jgi:hypothetical protein
VKTFATFIAATAVVFVAGCFDPLIGAQCAEGYGECTGDCVDLATDPANCGACGVTCAGSCVQGLCSEGAGALTCDGELVASGFDPDNCGACGRSCDSGLCENGICLGDPPGQLVLIGHDYVQSRPGMQRLLGNAVLLAPDPEVEVLAYYGTASAASIRGVDAAVDAVAAELGRTVTRVVVGVREGPALLSDFDVLLVYPQAGSKDRDLAAIGATWQASMTSFLTRGGVLVSLDGPAPHRGTFQILATAGLLEVSARTEVSSAAVTVISPTDALATNVPLVYAAADHTVSFSTTEPYAVVADDDAPVVLRKLW